jgi:hypothetical protein
MENIEARPYDERTLFVFRLEIEAPKGARLLDLTRVINAISGVIPPKWKIQIKSPR